MISNFLSSSLPCFSEKNAEVRKKSSLFRGAGILPFLRICLRMPRCGFIKRECYSVTVTWGDYITGISRSESGWYSTGLPYPKRLDL
jgi:hypothetical protein